MKEETERALQEYMTSYAREILSKCVERASEFKKAAEGKPFHKLLFPQEVIIASELERSMTRGFGGEFYPKIAQILASSCYKQVKSNHPIKGEVDLGMIRKLDDILESLDRSEREPDAEKEIKEILGSKSGKSRTERATADFFIGDYPGGPLCLEFKTPWPKKEDCIRSKKRIILIKLILAEKEAKSFVAFPYDPFGGWDKWHWTARKVFDRREVKIAEEVWDELGGEGTYRRLIELADKIGESVRKETKLFDFLK